MISKALTKRIMALHTKKGREREGLFLVEGRKAMLELATAAQATGSGWQPLLFILPEPATDTDMPAWQAQLQGMATVPCYLTDTATLAALSTLQNNAEGIALVSNPGWPAFAPSAAGLYLALDGIRDPGNLGTLIRLADWFSIPHILASADTCEWQNPKTIAASMGSFLRVQVHYGALASLLEKIPVRLGATLQGASSYGLAQGNNATALVIGSESHGIRQEVLPLLTQQISIPGHGGAESLNAALAAAMLLYELHRR